MSSVVLEDLRIHRSSTRRKSCQCCIKAKRRCDLTLPLCTRCREKGLNCVYNDAGSGGRAGVSKKTRPSKLRVVVNQVEVTPDPDMIANWVISTTGETQTTQMALDWAHVPTLHSFSFPELGFISPPQIEYCIKNLKKWTSSFVFEGQTPFMHALSYPGDDKPPLYQDALGICSLYLHQTQKNRDAIFRIIDCKLAALVNQSVTWISVKDNLLGLQVLALLQIIRLFDGCPRQRANAERDFTLFESWTLQLHMSYCESTTLATSTSKENWILMESVRRTILVSIVLRDLFCAQETGVCELVPLMSSMPMSKNSDLWTSAFMGQVEPREHPLLTYGEYTLAWNNDEVDGVDEYEKLLLVACRKAKGTGKFMM